MPGNVWDFLSIPELQRYNHWSLNNDFFLNIRYEFWAPSINHPGRANIFLTTIH